MPKAYWLSRKAAALKLAREATSSKARLVHYDFAGHYSVKAAAAERPAVALDAPPAADVPREDGAAKSKYHA